MRKLTLEDCRHTAFLRGGQCLAREYVSAMSPIEWQCNAGHVWAASLSSIKNSKSWCPYCAGQIKHTIDECIGFAKTKDGLCLSCKYESTDSKLLWRCSAGHEWLMSFKKVRRGHWCPECAGVKRLSISDCNDVAKNKGGKCLSKEYFNNKHKMMWECSDGHRWLSSLGNIKSKKRWCPECSEKKTQKLLTNIIRDLFSKLDVYSDYRGFGWLYNKSGTRRQEVDIWIPELKLAIEYDGEQHFRPVCFGGISKDAALKNLHIVRQLDANKNSLIGKHPEDVKYFVRFNYTEKIDKNYVSEKLKSIGINI